MGWDNKADCLAYIVDRAYWAEQERVTYATDMPWVQEAIDAGNALLACQRIKSSMARVHNFMRYTNHWDETYDPPYLLPYYLTHHLDGAVTWESIVEAWVKDDFEGRAWTIAVIDRMRQILWDEPFNIIWAARPEQEEL